MQVEGTFEVVDADRPLHWLWCGHECAGHWIGPHSHRHWAELDAAGADCDHDHAIFEMSPRAMADKLPSGVFSTFDGRFWVPQTDGSAVSIIKRSDIYPSLPFGLAVAWILEALLTEKAKPVEEEVDPWDAAW